MTKKTKQMTDLNQVAKGFSAFSSPPRLLVYLEIIKRGDDGLTSTEIQTLLKIPSSTLAHHLRILKDAGVIIQHRKERNVLCKPNFSRVEYLASYLYKNCCEQQDCCEKQVGSK